MSGSSRDGSKTAGTTSTISGFVLVFVFAFVSVFVLVCSNCDFAIAQEKKRKDGVPGKKVGCAKLQQNYVPEIRTNMDENGQTWANMDKYG